MYRATPEQYTFFCYFDVEKFTDPISVSLKKFGSCFIRKKQNKFTQNLPLNPNRSLNTVRKFEKENGIEDSPRVAREQENNMAIQLHYSE